MYLYGVYFAIKDDNDTPQQLEFVITDTFENAVQTVRDYKKLYNEELVEIHACQIVKVHSDVDFKGIVKSKYMRWFYVE